MVAGVAFWQGGIVVGVFVALLSGAIGWEIARMLGAQNPLITAGLTALAVFLASLVTWEMRAPFLIAACGIAYGTIEKQRMLFVIAYMTTALGALSFLLISSKLNLAWIGWLVGVVVITDIAGYFAGRVFGGPKFWPSISPKKTWSGTSAGWVGAAVFGGFMMGPLGASADIIAMSVIVSFASQMGDIFQSFVKRRVGVKDSSALIPGHGGVWDRFDGMLGAALVYWPLTFLF